MDLFRESKCGNDSWVMLINTYVNSVCKVVWDRICVYCGGSIDRDREHLGVGCVKSNNHLVNKQSNVEACTILVGSDSLYNKRIINKSINQF